MPIYVYQCRRCDVRTEVFFAPAERERTRVCEACGSAELERVFTPVRDLPLGADQLEQLDPKYYPEGGRGDPQHAGGRPDAPPEAMTPFDRAAGSRRSDQVLTGP